MSNEFQILGQWNAPSTELTAPVVDGETGDTVDLNQAYWQRTIAARIKQKIDDFALSKADDGYRSHLGWSVIGRPCMRYLYYHWRWFWKEVHHARMERIFVEGHKIEKELRIILREAGAFFLDHVDETGQQVMVSELGGHFGGSCDGVFIWPAIGLNQPTLLETKSSKTGADFSNLEPKGMMVVKPVHFDQQSGYGRGLGIKYSCYIVRNKNDSNLYVEIVDLDWAHANDLKNKAAEVMQLRVLPNKISEKRNYFVCNMCSMQEICHDRKQPSPNCRNCIHSNPAENAQWFCNRWNSVIPKEAIPVGCTSHEFLPW